MTARTARALIRRGASLLVAAQLACGYRTPPPPPASSHRLDTLARAFAARGEDPRLAADLFAAAGPGSILERARLDAWFRALDNGDADCSRWRAFLDARPPIELEGAATLALADALVGEGDPSGAVAVLTAAPDAFRSRAELAMLGLVDDRTAAGIAKRLARSAPSLLRSRSPSLDRAAVAGFELEDWLERAAAWRAAGLGSRGAAELRGRRERGDGARAWRVELASCELDAGSPGRALSVLPATGDASAAELVLRAEAHRRRAWGRSPDPASIRSFASCLGDARRAAETAGDTTRERALTLVLECGTEAGDLTRALDAWRQLEASGWVDGRRSWLGRRLGVALARSGAASDVVLGVASSLPEHDRCLRYWQAVSRSDRDALAALAAAKVSDLYGRWAARALGSDLDPNPYVPPRPAGSVPPPLAVSWLLDRAGPADASDEWQRLLAIRHPTAAEAVAAAELAARAGHNNTAIRSLRARFPDIGSVAIAEVPIDAARGYLPLRWIAQLDAAADETGLDPWLLAGLARQESAFTANARSPAGAVGVMQLLPSTARGHGRALGLGSRPELTDPAINITIGARELARLIRIFGALEPSLAAYNAGETRARRWRKQWPETEIFTESIPIPETYTYVRRVMFLSEAYRQIHADAWR